MTVGTGSAALPLSLYREISRSDWARLAPGMAQPLTAGEIAQIRGLGDRLDMDEVREVYLPLSRLLSLYATAAKSLGAATSGFLARTRHDDPLRARNRRIGRGRKVHSRADCCRSCSAAGRTRPASNW